MSYCKCGGYLGSGGVDGYAGRWCKCSNPVLTTTGTSTSTTIGVNAWDWENLTGGLSEPARGVPNRKTVELNLLTVTKIYALIRNLDLAVYEPSILEEIEEALK